MGRLGIFVRITQIERWEQRTVPLVQSFQSHCQLAESAWHAGLFEWNVGSIYVSML